MAILFFFKILARLLILFIVLSFKENLLNQERHIVLKQDKDNLIIIKISDFT